MTKLLLRSGALLIVAACTLAACSSSGGDSSSDTVRLPDREPAGRQDSCDLPSGQYQSGFDMATSFADAEARFPQIVMRTGSSAVTDDQIEATFDLAGSPAQIDPAALPPGQFIRYEVSFLEEPGGPFTDVRAVSGPEGWMVVVRAGPNDEAPVPEATVEVVDNQLVIRAPASGVPPLPSDPIVLYTATWAESDSKWVRTTCPVR
jgi:hypothetical protein